MKTILGSAAFGAALVLAATGQMPAASPGPMTHATTVHGGMKPGPQAPMAMPAGKMSPGATTHGAMKPGAMTHGAMKGGAMMPHGRMMAMKSLVIKLRAQNKSGEGGTATLADSAKGLHVRLSISGGPEGVAQPAHIHDGTCAKLDPAPAYPLKSVVNGVSNTTIPGVTIAKLEKEPYAINVHKSAAQLKVYVACGNITAAK